tara:strand:+ start:481 stop:735 length:255 start_codon:yes stop_codon:yes gene_type:complete
MSEETKYFIIEKSVFNFDKEPHFNIMKDKAFNLTDATKMLIAYEQLNDREEKTYYLQEVNLILDDKETTIVKTTSEEEDDRIPF